MNQDEINLIKSQKNKLEVCKEGIAFLRTFKNKKLRIVFNITYHNESLNAFNSQFFGKKHTESQCLPSEQGRLTVSRFSKELPKDRVIIMLNAYEKSQNHPLLLILGYLAASVVLYHDFQAEFSKGCCLTKMLYELKHLLERTNIDELNSQIKYKSGFAKNPYLLCLVHNRKCHKNVLIKEEFKEFYKHTDDQRFNASIDALLDYFPERSATLLDPEGNTLKKISREYEENILGREIFNFEFTSSSFENLLFQFCEFFNTSSKEIDLVFIYNKIILNQKVRIQGLSVQYFIKEIQAAFFHKGKIILEQTSNNVFPMPKSQLIKKLENIKSKCIRESLEMAANCMTLPEYHQIFTRLTILFESKSSELLSFNGQKCEQLCFECFQVIENLDLADDEINSEGLQNLLRIVEEKLQSFHNACSEIVSQEQQSYLNFNNKLLSKYLKTVSNVSVKYLRECEYQLRNKDIEIEELKYNFKVLEHEKKRLEIQYEQQGNILEQYKLKIYEFNLHKNSQQKEEYGNHIYQREICKMKKQIQELEEEVQDKNIEIEDLNESIERFEGLVDKDNIKSKFSKEFNELMKEVSIKVNSFYDLIRQINQIDKFYQEVKKKLNDERESLACQRKKQKEELNKKISELDRVVKEKKLLEEVINEAKAAISVYKNVDQQSKNSINELQNRCATINCLMLTIEYELEQYRKVIILLTEQITKGKSDKLLNFYKSIKCEELKENLKILMKK